MPVIGSYKQAILPLEITRGSNLSVEPVSQATTPTPSLPKEKKTSLAQKTFQALIDYRDTTAGRFLLQGVATSLHLVNQGALACGVNLGIGRLVEGELNRKLFQPEIAPKVKPLKALKEPLEMVILKDKGEPDLYGYYFEKKDSDLAVIYLHGYNGSIFECYPECLKINETWNANVLIVDYPGFGLSEGKPTIDGVVKSVERTYDHLIQKGFKGKNILMYGVSLGGAIALETYVTKLKPQGKKVGAIALLYPFSSIQDITKWRYPEIPHFIIPNDKLNSAKLAKHLDVPLHLAHGDADAKTPCNQTQKIYRSAAQLSGSGQKQIYIINGLGHDDLTEANNPSVDGYFESVRSFIRANFPRHTL